MNMPATLIALTMAAVAGCATRGSVRALPEESGRQVLFKGTVRAAALAARNAVVATPLQLVEAGEREGDAWYLIAKGPGGEYVRVVCQDRTRDLVAVRVAVKRDTPLDGRGDWAETLFAQISLELDTIPIPPRVF